MTPNDILPEIRSKISDESSVRWTDSVLRTYMYSGEIRIVNDDPESQYIVRVRNSTPTLLTSNTDSFTIDGSYRNEIINYVAAQVLAEDDEDQNNNALAKKFFQLFLEGMGQT